MRWTILAGTFGSGKTTAALTAALATTRIPIFIRCADIEREKVATGANELLEDMIGAVGVFDYLPPEDAIVINELAGPLFGGLLKDVDGSGYSLILDGLDENRHFSTLDGLQRLNNQLIDLVAPILMTVRTEMLESLFGNFSVAFSEVSATASSKPGRLLTLGAWNTDGINQLLEVAAEEGDASERQEVRRLQELVHSGTASDFYGDLLTRPLFLSFIIDDVRAHGVRRSDRASLVLEGWVRRKIYRDQTVPRVSAAENRDVDEVVSDTFLLLEDVARAMTRTRAGSAMELVDSVDAVQIRQLSVRHLGPLANPVLVVLLNSVLVPRPRVAGGRLEIGFAHGALQELFLARWIARHSDKKFAKRVPASVCTFLAELGFLEFAPRTKAVDRLREVISRFRRRRCRVT